MPGPRGLIAVAERLPAKNSLFSETLELNDSTGLSIGDTTAGNGVAAFNEQGASDQELSLVVL